ncbi:MAG: hypothetical protein ASARMPRED_000013 [Alectoria sarmentosa]|nr:MAG: hypothetical protein ASARMPRED_000013 [Alectoria sarmentosa]
MAASLGAPLKVLTRPLASDQDPAAGFSFAKAKPPLPNTVNVAAHQGPSPEHHTTSVVKDPFNVPFPKVTFATTDLASGHSPAKTVKNIDQPQANMQNRSLKASRDPLTSVARAPKITKSRGKKTRLGAATDDPPQPLNPKYAYTEDDLLRLLMYRRRQGQQELEDFRATQQQKETEIQRLLDISNDLYSQLQDFEKRETQTNAELTKIKANKPIWETKIKQLSDYVKGLTNDHNRLRDDADDLRKRHGDVFVAERERSNRLEDQISGLKDSMNSFVEGIARSVEACKETSNSMGAGQRQLALAMEDQLRALSGKILSEHALSEQISDLREVRATVRERLQATESSLADARREIISLRLKDQEQLGRIASLETVAARAQSQSAETQQTLLRIQEFDSRNSDLQSEIDLLRKENADLSSQLQRSSTDAREVTVRLAAMQDQFEAAREETARSREEKSTSERQAMLEREQLRKELSKAASTQLASMQSEHMNVIQQLRLEKSPAEEKLKSVTKQVNMLKVERDKHEKETAQLQALLKGAQSEKEAVIGTRKAVQLHLKEMESRMHEKNNEYRDVQAMLNKANDQVKAKDLEIMALQTSQALSIDQTSSIQPTDPKYSRHLTNRPPIVEDSQPTGKPPFVSLDDLMLDDPFAGYSHEGPQTIAGEDISHLFPSTPGVSRAKDLNYSRNAVFRTAVVSETQRRHQSFRENTPHSSRTTSKAHSQSQARNSSTAISPTKVTPRRRDTNIPTPHREANITRESSQPQGSVKDPRQGKRNTVAAGFNETNSSARPSKMQKAEPLKKALGPIIEDSQSPLLNGRSRKMTRRKSSAPKDDKFTRRFAQP